MVVKRKMDEMGLKLSKGKVGIPECKKNMESLLGIKPAQGPLAGNICVQDSPCIYYAS